MASVKGLQRNSENMFSRGRVLEMAGFANESEDTDEYEVHAQYHPRPIHTIEELAYEMDVAKFYRKLQSDIIDLSSKSVRKGMRSKAVQTDPEVDGIPSSWLTAGEKLVSDLHTNLGNIINKLFHTPNGYGQNGETSSNVNKMKYFTYRDGCWHSKKHPDLKFPDSGYLWPLKSEELKQEMMSLFEMALKLKTLYPYVLECQGGDTPLVDRNETEGIDDTNSLNTELGNQQTQNYHCKNRAENCRPSSKKKSQLTLNSRSSDVCPCQSVDSEYKNENDLESNVMKLGNGQSSDCPKEPVPAVSSSTCLSKDSRLRTSTKFEDAPLWNSAGPEFNDQLGLKECKEIRNDSLAEFLELEKHVQECPVQNRNIESKFNFRELRKKYPMSVAVPKIMTSASTQTEVDHENSDTNSEKGLIVVDGILAVVGRKPLAQISKDTSDAQHSANKNRVSSNSEKLGAKPKNVANRERVANQENCHKTVAAAGCSTNFIKRNILASKTPAIRARVNKAKHEYMKM